MKKILFFKLLLICSIELIYAQKEIKFAQKEINKNDVTIFVKLDNTAKLQNTNEQEAILLKQICNPEYKINFVKQRMYSDNFGFTHSVYQAYCNGIEIKDMCYSIHSKENIILFANGVYDNMSKVTAKAGLTQKSAMEIALQDFQRLRNDLLSSASIKQLVYCKNPIDIGAKYVLAYKVYIHGKSSADDYYFYIDANNGNIITKEPLVCNNAKNENKPLGNATGSTTTLYNGPQNFVTDTYNGEFRLREKRNNVNIITLNAYHQSDKNIIVTNATDFLDNDNNWQANEHGADMVATDIHWGAEKILDYWQQVQSRNSIDGNGLQIRSFVHVSTCFDNAYWDPAVNSMFYGDGCSIFNPLGALDVSAHEIGHGVCQFTSNLGTGTSEAAAMNEGFSDIWGASIEAWAAPTKQRWLIGEEIIKNNSYNCIRNLQNPKSTMAEEGQHPNTYHGTYWDNNGEPHTNSTVLSHWFYLLSEGGNGTNDLNNAYSVIGIGLDHASKIAYLTETLLNSSANYTMARIMSIQAAQQLYGLGSCEEVAVTKAWYAVGVGLNYTSSIGAYINGSYKICTGTQQFTLSGLPSGVGITWSSSNSSIATVFSSGSTANVTQIGNGIVTLTASFTGSCGNIAPATKTLYIGYNYTNASVVGPQIVYANSMYSYTLSASPWYVQPDLANFNWQVPVGWSIVNGQGSNYINVQTGSQGGQVQVNFTDPCGNPTGRYISANIGTGGSNPQVIVPLGLELGSPNVEKNVLSYEITISPNPARSILRISVPQNYSKYYVEIIDTKGSLLKKMKLFSSSNEINISHLADGIYFIKIRIKGENKIFRFIKQE